MGQEVSEIVFKWIWGLLLVIAVSAQVLFKGKVRRKGGLGATLLVMAPYAVVFGWFSARQQLGTFPGWWWSQMIGLGLMFSGMAGYFWSIACLRHNWTVSAAVKEGHALVQHGPYRWVRHPMYSSMTIVVFGSGLLVSNFMIVIYTPVVLLLYFIRARIEEKLLREALPGYGTYVGRTKMLIPGLL